MTHPRAGNLVRPLLSVVVTVALVSCSGSDSDSAGNASSTLTLEDTEPDDYWSECRDAFPPSAGFFEPSALQAELEVALFTATLGIKRTRLAPPSTAEQR